MLLISLRACLKSHFGQSYLHGNRVFSSKLGFFRNPERPTLFKHILSLYSANRVRSMIGTWFSSPTVWENQRLPPNAARSGLPNPQHLGTISCFLKQVLSIIWGIGLSPFFFRSWLRNQGFSAWLICKGGSLYLWIPRSNQKRDVHHLIWAYQVSKPPSMRGVWALLQWVPVCFGDRCFG